MATEESKKRLLLIVAGILAADIILFGIGSWCLLFVDKPHSTTIEREYIRTNVCNDTELPALSCAEFKPSLPPYLAKCQCELNITVEHDIKGAITLYYELEDFDQTKSSYASSKDDKQLLGSPGARPAESCGNYSYNGNLPIFPCGEIADSIFNDTFTLLEGVDITVPKEYTDLLTGDTLKYRNPPPDALKNFSAPLNWGKVHTGERPWEKETELKGVENPAFRAWMDTSLKRKPAWRVQRKDKYLDGLPAGNYILVIYMHYGVDRYDGPRKVILEGVYMEAARRNLGWGVALVLLACILLVLGAGYIYTQQKRISSARNDAKPSNNETETPFLNIIYNRLRNTRAK